MVNLIARRAIFKTKAGGTLRVTQKEALVLRALKLADDMPAAPVVRKPYRAAAVAASAPTITTWAGSSGEKAPARTSYKRRDLTAEKPVDD